MPAGITTRHAYETLRDELLQDLRNAGPVDVALFGLHGAMVADGYDDCEGDLLRRAREIVGPDTVIGAELDPHCHLTATMMESADLIVCYKEYPTPTSWTAPTSWSTCAWPRPHPASARRVRLPADLGHAHQPRTDARLRRQADGDGRQERRAVDLDRPRLPGATPPTWAPRRWSIPMAMPAAARSAGARDMGQDSIGWRASCRPPCRPYRRGTGPGLAHGAFPVVLADSADNAGGGAPSDATFILERVLARGIDDVAMGPFWDPVSVQLCFEAGEGAEVQLRVGGKVAPVSGQPLDLRCTVLALKREAVMTGLSNTPALLGDVAILRTGGVVLALTSLRTQAMGTDMFTQFGIDLAAMKLIVVKSSQHFYASYSQVAKHVIYVATPGAITQDYNSLPYRKVQRPKWPLTA